MTAAVIVSIRVDATPLRAFEAFTEEIGEWWRPNPLFALTPRGDGHLRFEPGEGGRLVATLANGKEFEVGRITVWEPGERLALTWRQATFASGRSTQLDVRFEAVGDQTRVTVEHRGWDEIPQDHVARHGFELMLFHGDWLNTGAHCSPLLTRRCVATLRDGKGQSQLAIGQGPNMKGGASRERDRLIAERGQHVNRIKGLCAVHGIMTTSQCGVTGCCGWSTRRAWVTWR
jgi:uncharacterized protein YndB with AHSA1/START domain